MRAHRLPLRTLAAACSLSAASASSSAAIRSSSACRAARAQSLDRLLRSMPVLPGAPSRTAAQAGASAGRGGSGRVHLKGLSLFAHDALTFAPSQPVQQPVHGLDFLMEAPVMQLTLPLLGRIDAPDAVPRALLATVRSYREAVRLCWTLRRAKGLKPTDLGRDFGFTRQHVSDYLNSDDLPTRRDLPADRIADFEDVCGNTAITQWLASHQRFTLLEEMQADRNAA